MTSPILVAKDGGLALDHHPRHVHRDYHHRLLMGPICFGICHTHHDRQLAPIRSGPGAEPLATVDHVVVAFTSDAGSNVGGIRTGDGGLGHRKAGPNLAFQERVQPRLHLVGRPKHVKDLHISGIRSRAIQRLWGQCRTAPGDLCERGVFENGETRPEFIVGEKEIPKTALTGLHLQLLEDRRIVVRIARCLHLLSIDRLGRIDVAIHEPDELGAQLFDLGAVGEVHGARNLAVGGAGLDLAIEFG